MTRPDTLSFDSSDKIKVKKKEIKIKYMKNDKYPIEELSKWEEELLSSGIPRYKVHQIIGRELGVSRVTIYRHLVPGQNDFSFLRRSIA